MQIRAMRIKIMHSLVYRTSIFKVKEMFGVFFLGGRREIGLRPFSHLLKVVFWQGQ